MKNITQYKNIHKNKPIAILGGGVDLLDDVDKIPKESILISVNYHAETQFDCDYITFLDNPSNIKDKKTNFLFNAVIDQFDGEILSPGYYKNYDTAIKFDVRPFNQGFPISGIFALWCAEYFGGNPIILCGFDCFTKGNHFYDKNTKTSHNPELHIKFWRQYRPIRKNNIYVASGPLIDIFKEWK